MRRWRNKEVEDKKEKLRCKKENEGKDESVEESKRSRERRKR